jgi:DNA repair and recombination protein RAD54B
MNPSMAHGYPPTKIVSAVLFIVPANTIVNWQNEVEKWTPDLNCFQLGGVKEGYREQEINKWKRQGGLLFMGDGMFRRMAGYITKSAQPDVLVLDEAHTMLKSDQTQISKLLQAIKTPRVILATGTPLQNNITEFYHMAEFIRPGVFGTTTVKEFEEIYR